MSFHTWFYNSTHDIENLAHYSPWYHVLSTMCSFSWPTFTRVSYKTIWYILANTDRWTLMYIGDSISALYYTHTALLIFVRALRITVEGAIMQRIRTRPPLDKLCTSAAIIGTRYGKKWLKHNTQTRNTPMCYLLECQRQDYCLYIYCNSFRPASAAIRKKRRVLTDSYILKL